MLKGRESRIYLETVESKVSDNVKEVEVHSGIDFLKATATIWAISAYN